MRGKLAGPFKSKNWSISGNDYHGGIVVDVLDGLIMLNKHGYALGFDEDKNMNNEEWDNNYAGYVIRDLSGLGEYYVAASYNFPRVMNVDGFKHVIARFTKAGALKYLQIQKDKDGNWDNIQGYIIEDAPR